MLSEKEDFMQDYEEMEDYGEVRRAPKGTYGDGGWFQKVCNSGDEFLVSPFKTSFFELLFSQKDAAAALYYALSGSDPADLRRVRMRMIQNAIHLSADGDDVGFIVDLKTGLHACQKIRHRWTDVSFLYYFMDSGNELQDPLDEHKVQVPIYIAFCNGSVYDSDFSPEYFTRDFVSEKVSRLSIMSLYILDLGKGNCEVFKNACRPLTEYLIYTDRIRARMGDGLLTRNHVEEVIDSCIDDGILADFFCAHREEAVITSIYDYNQTVYALLDIRDARKKIWLPVERDAICI